jgi:geranylgeranyl reductase family protein
MLEPHRDHSSSSGVVHADVGIIGAGPAGLAAAVHLGQLGIGRVVIVDRMDFPRDKTCGSAVSPKGCTVLDELGVRGAVTEQAYPINGMRLVTPRGHDVILSSSEDVAMICHRRTLDHLLLERAQEMGTQFLANFTASFLLQRGDSVVGFRSTDEREVRAKYTIVADGAHSRFAPERGPRNLIQAIMGWWDDVPFQANHIEMIFDRAIEPYYGWLFPEGPGRVNIGICYDDPRLALNARELFDRFLDKHYRQRLGNARQVGNYKGHPISYTTTVGRLTSPGRIVVGEAGRMTHPATAEGIYQGMRSGMLAAHALHSIIKRGVEAPQALAAYERACGKAFDVSFRGASVWRRFVSAGGLDLAVGLLNRPSSRRLLARCMAQM